MTGRGDDTPARARRARPAARAYDARRHRHEVAVSNRGEAAASAADWVRQNVCAHCHHAGPACDDGPQFDLCFDAILEDDDRREEMRRDLLADAPGPCKVCQLWDLEEGCIGGYDPAECAAMDEADLRLAGDEI